MSSTTSEQALHQLQSNGQAELLDAIDGLRHEHIGADINIPQIVVCGDQSSGKSSVLEAIAQVQFPVGIGTTTRFPIEFVLRRSSQTSITVKLRAAAHRSAEKREYIQKFESSFANLQVHQFPDVVREAARYLKEYEPDCNFWDDLLCAEFSGPNRPHLTLVDLPGVVHWTGKDSDEDTRKTRDIVLSYCQNPRSVMLAVISAAYELQLQEIMKLIEKTPSAKERTLGVITKPDKLEKGSSDEDKIIEMAENRSLFLGLGWHVLRNLSHDAADRSVQTRDNTEETFFREAPWSNLPHENVGIRALRQKLSKSLFERVTKDLPTLKADMQRKADDCNQSLLRLGTQRESATQQREYLVQVVSQLQRLIESALEGGPPKSEFSAFFDGSPGKRLRDVITQNSVAFAAEMRGKGKQFEIYSAGHFTIPLPHVRELGIDEDLNFHHPYALKDTSHVGPRRVTLTRYCGALTKHMSATRGRNLPGTISENIVHDIFRQQSILWESIVCAHVERCSKAAHDFMDLAVKHATGQFTGEKLVAKYLTPAFIAKDNTLDDKVSELLWPFIESHPTTNNPRYESAVRQHTTSGIETSTPSWIQQVREQSLADNLIPAAEAMGRADAYYEIALDTLVDNVATLAIERCLLNDLPRLILPAKLSNLNDDELSDIAGEPEDAQQERERFKRQLIALKVLIDACKRHAPNEQQDSLSTREIPPSTRVNDVAQTGNSSLFGNRTSPFNANNPPSGSGSLFGAGSRIASTEKERNGPDVSSLFGGRPYAENERNGPSVFSSFIARPSNENEKNGAGGSGLFGGLPSTGGGKDVGGSGLFGQKPSADKQKTGFGGFSKSILPRHKSTADCGHLFSVLKDEGLSEKVCFKNLSVHDGFTNSSFEELRLNDYANGHRGR